MITMKRLLFTSAIVMMALSCAMCADAGKSNVAKCENAEISNFEVQQLFKSAKSFYKCLDTDIMYDEPTSIFLETSVSIQWPVKIGDNNIKILQDSIIAKTFGKPLMSVDSAMIKCIGNPAGSEDLKKIEKVSSIPYANDNTRVWSSNTNVIAKIINERYAVYQISNDTYLGGAHPTYGASFINYDVKNNKVLSYTDIFKAGSDNDVIAKITARLIQQYNAKDKEALSSEIGISTDALLASKNIYLSENAITFCYNQYEIACYAMGVIEVTIPSYELDSCLTPEAKKLFVTQQ